MLTNALRAALLGGVLISAAPIHAEEKPASPPSSAEDDQKVVCRKEVVVGSIMPRRTCKTKGEWRVYNTGAQRQKERMLGGNGGMGTSSR
jgi:hypothetical protein